MKQLILLSRNLMFFALILLNGFVANAQNYTKQEITKGKFEATWESLEKNYQCPEWFRDAKFGIWAHWSVQCVPEAGDWYARGMYVQGDRYYNFHVKKYGHPSKFGMMELINLWKAENWNPEELMKLYKAAGAKYFMAMANHHDNFDTYDSKYHAWNAVNVGPKKDVIGIWEKVARKDGLYFGVSNHSAHAWHWLQTAYGYDPEGPMAGMRYDAATLTKDDGKGKWWEGLDPQDLYTGPNIVMPDSIKTIKEGKDWHEKNDRQWLETIPKQNPKFAENWFLRCQDLVDKYKPDVLYFDDFGLPMEQYGLDIVAHYYNANTNWNNGKNKGVINAKMLKGTQNLAMVEDVERGFRAEIEPAPWQTCSCIGDWHYNRSVFEENRYKSVNQIVKSLIDIVSKNGNLLLSVPLRPDGTLDSIEIAFLKGMAKWMEVNSEGIFETRPWKVYGEGPTQVKAGMFNENATKDFSAKDIRFTKKGDVIYAFVMSMPSVSGVLIKSLGLGSAYLDGKKLKSVSLMGFNGKLKWKQTAEGLKVETPALLPCEHAICLKIN